MMPKDDKRVRSLTLAMLASLAGLISANPATAAPRSDCIPLERGDAASPVITARLDAAGPFAFVLDTGSSGTTLDERRIRQLGLVPDGASEQAQGMGGAVDVHLFRMRSFRAGPLAADDLVVPGLAAPSFQSHDIAGLAGVDLFGRHMAIWRWDEACVQLAGSGLRPTGGGWRQIPARWLQPWKIMLPMWIGNVYGWGLLDTGAQRTILSPGFARLIGLTAAHARGGQAISGVEGRETALAAHDVAKASFGQWRFGHATVSVAALPLFDRLGGMDAPVAVIGMDWIAGRSFAIDYGKQQVWQRVGTKRETAALH